MRPERLLSVLAGVGAVLVALLTPPEPGSLLRLAAGGLIAAGVATNLLWGHPRAPFVAAALLVAGLALSPAPASPPWALAVAALALVSLGAPHAAGRSHAAAPALGVVALGAVLVVGVAFLLPRLSVAATPVLLLLAAVVLLALGALVALVRHGRTPEESPASPE